jgi:hypothetical protein
MPKRPIWLLILLALTTLAGNRFAHALAILTTAETP